LIHEETRALCDRDRRYWRRQANRHVRKKRRLRALARVSLVVGLNLAVLAVLGYSGHRAWRHLHNCEEFAIRTIEIEGTERCDPELLRVGLGDLLGRNVLTLDLEEVALRIDNEPWVESCTVRRVLPGTLRVAVSERSPRARARVDGESFVVDRSGTLLRPLGPPADSLPLLVGLGRLDAGARTAALRRGVSALERLRGTTGEWVDRVVEIDVSRADRLGVRTEAGGPRLLLDPQRVERNLQDYLALQAQIDRRVGPAEYVDLRWSDRITVMPSAGVGDL